MTSDKMLSFFWKKKKNKYRRERTSYETASVSRFIGLRWEQLKHSLRNPVERKSNERSDKEQQKWRKER